MGIAHLRRRRGRCPPYKYRRCCALRRRGAQCLGVGADGAGSYERKDFWIWVLGRCGLHREFLFFLQVVIIAPMHFAFSTLACPTWDFETIANRAKEYGYEGVEIRGFLNESILTASNVFLTDPKKLRSLFKFAGIEIACLASSIAMTGKKRADLKLADDCRKFIDTAAELGCGLVKVFDATVRGWAESVERGD